MLRVIWLGVVGLAWTGCYPHWNEIGSGVPIAPGNCGGELQGEAFVWDDPASAPETQMLAAFLSDWKEGSTVDIALSADPDRYGDVSVPPLSLEILEIQWEDAYGFPGQGSVACEGFEYVRVPVRVRPSWPWMDLPRKAMTIHAASIGRPEERQVGVRFELRADLEPEAIDPVDGAYRRYRGIEARGPVIADGGLLSVDTFQWIRGEPRSRDSGWLEGHTDTASAAGALLDGFELNSWALTVHVDPGTGSFPFTTGISGWTDLGPPPAP